MSDEFRDGTPLGAAARAVADAVRPLRQLAAQLEEQNPMREALRVLEEQNRPMREALAALEEQNRPMREALEAFDRQNEPLREVLASIEEQMRPFREAMEAVESHRAWADAARAASAPVERVLEQIGAFSQAVAAAVGPIDFERIRQGVARMLAEGERSGKLGWTIPTFTTPREFVELMESVADDEVDSAFEQFYAADDGNALIELKRSLLANESFLLWKPLLERAVTAYESDDHVLAVPALLSVVEGIAVKVSGEEWAKSQSPKPGIEARLNATPEESFSRAILSSVRAFIVQFFRFQDFEAAREASLSRHRVLHGRDDPRHWRKLDVLKLLQAIDSMAMFAREGEDDGEGDTDIDEGKGGSGE